MSADMKEFKEICAAQRAIEEIWTPTVVKQITDDAWTEQAMRSVRALKWMGAADVLLYLVEKHAVLAVAR